MLNLKPRATTLEEDLKNYNLNIIPQLTHACFKHGTANRSLGYDIREQVLINVAKGLELCIVSSDELPNLMQVTKTLFPSSRAGTLGVKDQAGEEMDPLKKAFWQLPGFDKGINFVLYVQAVRFFFRSAGPSLELPPEIAFQRDDTHSSLS